MGKYNMKKFVWLILFIIFSTSCSNMKSIRSGKFISVEEKAVVKNDYTKQEDFRHPDRKIEDEKFNTNLNSVRKIPTLREQMMALAEKQESINEKLNRLEENNLILLNEIQEIKRYVSENNTPNTKPITGIVENEHSSNKKYDNIYIIESDEEKSKKNNKDFSKQDLIKTELETPKNEFVNSKFNRKIDELKNSIKEKKFNSSIIELTKLKRENLTDDEEKEVKILLAESLIEIKQLKKAEREIEDLTKKFKNDEKIIALKARFDFKSGRIKEAKENYKKIIEKHPDSVYVVEAKRMLQIL